MDAVVRGGRPLLISTGAAAVLLAVACARTAPQGAVGTSDRARGGAAPRGEADAGAPSGSAALPAGYRTTFAKLNGVRFVSQGHAAGRWEVDLWANDAAREALAARARAVPVGAVVVAEHFEHVDGKPGPVMMMEKREEGYAPEHGDWRYVVVGSSGQLVKDGVVESCAGCHDDAPMDGLFPISP